MNRLFLLDAMALIYRAHFAFSKTPRINSKGMNTGAVLGFTNTLLEVIKKEKPSHIGVAFDTAEPTFRHKEFEAYKAQREAMPEDLSTAIPYIYKMVAAFNIPILVKPGYEADDIIGTIAKKAVKSQDAAGADFEVYMMTPDKDYAQIVEEKIFLYKPAFLGNDVAIWGIKEVLAKWEIKDVKQVIDILGLQGDAVDNIPGIPGIGEKTAIKLVQEYGSVEGLIENTDKLKGKQKENVEKFAEQGLLSKRLATIDTHVPIECEIENLKYMPWDEDAVKNLWDELEFRTLKSRFFKGSEGEEKKPVTVSKSKKSDKAQLGLFDSGSQETGEENQEIITEREPLATIHDTVHHYYKIDTPELRKQLIQLLEKQNEFCLDTETTGLDAIQAELVGFSVSWYPKEAYYVPFPSDQATTQAIIDEFKPVLENPAIAKIGQNIKYDLTVLKNYGIELQGKLFDTMLAHYLIEPDMRHNMDVLSENYLHYSPVSITTLIGEKGAKQGNMRDVEVDKIVEYAGEDADVTLQLKHSFEPLLKSQNLKGASKNGKILSGWSLERVFYEIENPLIPVLAEMEKTGVRIDVGSLEDISKELGTAILDVRNQIYQLAGSEFNIDSPKQLGEILFDKLKLDDKAKKTKTGQYATGEEILSKMTDKHPIINQMLEYRELVKLKNTYVDALPSMVNAKTGRIHTNYQQAVAATGRLSSINPNLQNIPIRTSKGREIRKAFVPRDNNYLLLSADYSQIELRIMAAFSGDETMLKAFQNGQDIHATTASKIYKVDLVTVDSDMRRKAKTANFGIIYGISAHGLSQRLNIPRKEAGEIINAYFEQFPAIKKYMDEVINQARKNEFVETLLGRRRYLRNINSHNAVERGNAERTAINAPIQGSAADMIKLAMIRIHEFLQKNKLKSKMILQVHDELVFDAHKDEIEILKPAIEDLMKNAISLPVPMEVGMGVGINWLEAH